MEKLTFALSMVRKCACPVAHSLDLVVTAPIEIVPPLKILISLPECAQENSLMARMFCGQKLICPHPT